MAPHPSPPDEQSRGRGASSGPRDFASSTNRLRLLHEILAGLNRIPDVREALDVVLTGIVRAMGLHTGWVVLRDATATTAMAGYGFALAAHVELPSAMRDDEVPVWGGLCSCEASCMARSSRGAYNEVSCPRTARLRAESGVPGVHACAPLRLEGEDLGMLNVATRDWQPLDDDHLQLLEAVAEQLAQAMERSGVHERRLAKRVQEQATMLDLSRRLLMAHELDDVMEPLLDQARATLDADACVLLLPGREDQSLQFRAAVGWHEDPAAANRQIPPELPCGARRAMERRQPILIEDLDAEPIAALALPWLRRERFRGYVAVPLIGRSSAVGALVVNTRTPRVFKDHETRFVQLLANTAALAIESDALKSAAARTRRLQRELDLAHDIQEAMVPSPGLELPGWDLASSYDAAHEIGGDFFDVLPGPGSEVGLVVGDVSGKSISGALLMVSSIAAIREAIRADPDPVAVLTAVNARLRRRIRPDRFVTACCGVLDTDTGHLRYASAGHNAPILARADTGDVIGLPIGGTALGIFDDPGLTPCEVQLRPGDMLLIYTDGVTEALDPDRRMFGEDNLLETVADTHGAGPADLKRALLERLDAHRRGAPASDDVTLLALRRHACRT